MNKVMRFSVKIDNVEKVDSRFSKCKIRVLYAGLNRNNTYISEKAINEASTSIFNIPIVGEYNKDSQNFRGHGGKIDTSGDKPEYVETTMAYGVVPESANIYWESVEENDGTVNKYYVVDGAYLWTDRYEEANDLLEREYNQSMEIKNIEGNFSTIDGKKVYEVKKFVFSGLCILGVNKESDPNGNVTPCFESASIVAYSLIDNNFKNDFSNMVSELKFSLQGGRDLKKKNYSLTASQLLSEAEREVAGLGTYTDEYWGFDIQNFYLVDIDTENSNVIAFDNQKHYLVGATFSVDGDKLSLDKESLKRFKVDYAPMDIETDTNFTVSSFNKFAETVKEKTEKKVKFEYEVQVVDIEKKFNSLQQELDEVNSKYSDKIQAEKEEAERTLFESFASELSEEEMKSVKDNKNTYTLYEVENQLFAILGKKKAKFSLQPNKESLIDITQKENKQKSSGKVYDDLFDEE
ncbi:hypothetical protein [Paenibacillus sp. FSL H3-0286]|uniref:hypothetical protein n=1 Tax=Paenibacillus sp. FSL H3-0286 TaxID=2921427 RepID=UPI0032545034